MVVTISQVEKAHNKAHEKAKDQGTTTFVCFKVKKNEHDPTQVTLTFENGEWEDMYEILDELREPQSKCNADFFFKVYPELSIAESFKKAELQMIICKARMKKMVNIDKPSGKTQLFIETIKIKAEI